MEDTERIASEPMRWWRGWQADLAVTLVVGVIQILGTHLAAQGQPERKSLDAIAYLLLAAGPIALMFRRRFPIPTYIVVFGTTLAYTAAGYPRGPIWLPLIISLFSVVLAGHRWVALGSIVAGYVAFLWLPYLLGDEPAPSLAGAFGLAAWLIVLLFAAEFVRARKERALEAIRIRDEEARRHASEERLRIARELHDALGHHLSLINVQAGVALHVNADLPEQAHSALDAIKQASKEGLTELRSVLDILREGNERPPRSPSPSIAKLDELVRGAEVAGATIRIETIGTARPLPFGVDTAAYRIVQESLTNVARHAGEATATVTMEYGDRDLVVEVDDDGRGTRRNTNPGSGKGILGMRERVAALGGELEAGPRSIGGFRVRARFPLDGSG
jgi:signal transduction histidine kinase